MTIYETDIPGVGRKFEVDLDGNEQLVIIIHHDGKREVYHRSSPDVDSEKLFALSGKRAREVGSILQGAYFQPVETDDIEVPLGEAIIEWNDVGEESPLASQSLRDARIRQQAGVSVIAIQRSSQTIANPKPEFEIEAGDILVTLGTREEQNALEQLLATDQSPDESD